MLMKKCVSALRFHVIIGMTGFGVASAARGGVVEVTDIFWFFDQGGYVQVDPFNFQVFQDTYGPNLPENIVEGQLGGASFISTATMNTSMTQIGDSMHFAAISEFTVEATVDAGTPQGLAQAYASFMGFGVTFSVTGRDHVYTGTESLINDEGMDFGSGSTLAPGSYSFQCQTCGAFIDTDFVGPGRTVTDSLTREFHFEFAPIPAPGALAAVVLAFVFPPRRRRR